MIDTPGDQTNLGQDAGALGPRKGIASESAKEGRAPRSPRVPTSLLQLYTIDGAKSEALLRELAKDPSWMLDEAEVQEFLDRIKELDPGLKRTRTLLHHALDAQDGRFSHTVAQLAARAIATTLEPLDTWPSDGFENCTARLESGVEQLRPYLSENATRRRAVNAIVMLTDLLASRGDLGIEQAVPILIHAFGPPAEYSKDRRHPRRHRMTQLTDGRLELKSLRGFLDAFTPWIREVDELTHVAEAAERRAGAAWEEADRAVERKQELERRVAALEEKLDDIRTEAAQARGEATEARVAAGGDVAGLRKRYRKRLNGPIRNRIETAVEAAELDPPLAREAAEFLREALAEIDSEMKWLESSA